MPTDSSKLWRPDKEMLSVVPGKEFQGALLLPGAGVSAASTTGSLENKY